MFCLCVFVNRNNGNLTASFDGAWQKRGTGRAYNSLTGKKKPFLKQV